ncbi:unnamed protein product [Cylindrotheca closterium]|uniref:Uncharacterized protein n=1 Tax=Cylindrotheca closterium TaxID=2856 RepID=A0AAD2FUB6_9STRA|nr:unnamed protein product [Cylindrotheca closterium]
MSTAQFAIDLSVSDDENDISPSSGLTTFNPSRKPDTTATNVTTNTSQELAGTIRRTSDNTAVSPTPRKKAKPSTSFALIWVCTHGNGRRTGWRKKDLKLVGIYASKAAAEEAKRKVMSEHERAGHGDICVGDTWEDEIDLLIREAPLFV